MIGTYEDIKKHITELFQAPMSQNLDIESIRQLAEKQIKEIIPLGVGLQKIVSKCEGDKVTFDIQLNTPVALNHVEVKVDLSEPLPAVWGEGENSLTL